MLKQLQCMVLTREATVKPEPIMLLILPIILSRISHNFHPLFFIYSHAIIYYSSNLIVSLVKLHMAAAKIVYFSAIKIDNIILFLILLIVAFIFIIRLMLDLFH